MSRTRLLLVTAEPGGDSPLASALLDAAEEGEGFAVTRVGVPEDVGEPAGEAVAADVALLTLPLPGRRGLVPFVELRARAPDLPIVVLCGQADEPLALKALQLGAADYLIVENLYGTLLRRCLQHAVEAEQVRRQLAEQEEAVAAELGPAGDRRAAGLRVALPREFEALAEEYGTALDRAVEQVLYRLEDAVEPALQRLARRAGELRAGPRDVVEIHALVMKERERAVGPQRAKLYAQEGRMRLLELMGRLAGYYRAAYLDADRRATRPLPREDDR